MTIATRDQLIDGLGNNSSRLVIDKASIASQAAGTFVSLWRATGQPGQGAIPAATEADTNGFDRKTTDAEHVPLFIEAP